MEKYCSVCKKLKPFKDFHKSKTTKDGLQYKCAECMKIYLSSYVVIHTAEQLARIKARKKIYEKTYIRKK